MPAFNWPQAPAQPRFSPGEACLFAFSLDLPEDRLARLRALLSADEQARAARLINPGMRLHWTAARAQTREIVGACLGRDPAGLRFTQNPYGKPALEDGGDLRFNTSHSGAFGLLAVVKRQEVGIDMELVREDLDWENIARRFFAKGEMRTLLDLPPDQQLPAFFRCWTRKEAYLKVRGKGLSLPLDGFEVTLAPADPPRLIRPEEPYSIYEINPGKPYAAAMVVEGSVVKINAWQWQG